MNKAVHIGLVIGLIIFSTWLFSQEKAAEPGPRRTVHAENAGCGDCHQPWRRVGDRYCVGCHSFADTEHLRPAIRFHEAEVNCLKCHTEHRGSAGKISRMDHTLLNPDLFCSKCHLNPHGKLFGEDCRACHALSTWSVDGYRHPSEKSRDCSRCHPPPLSHQNDDFWRVITKRHYRRSLDTGDVDPAACWQCHVTHDWRHLRM